MSSANDEGEQPAQAFMDLNREAPDMASAWESNTDSLLIAPNTLVDTTTEAILTLGLTCGPYKVLSILDKGSMAVVFRGAHIHTHAPVAIKILKGRLARESKSLERFRREAVALAAIQHENVVRVHMCGLLNQRPFMILDLLVGSVRHMLDDAPGRQLPVKRVAQIARDVLAGLEVSHEAGLLHRDIKPANLLIDAAGRAMITDFGLVKSIQKAPEPDLDLTRDGATVGTPIYMAPEQAVGGQLDARSDLYAVGLTCYEALAGSLPFKSESWTELLALSSKSAPDLRDRRPGVPADIALVVDRLLAPRRTERYASATDALLALQICLANLGGHAPGQTRNVAGIRLHLSCRAGSLFADLRPGESVTIGRAGAADLTVREEDLSRLHTEFRATGGGLEVLDRGSTNGTRVRERAVTGEPVSVQSGEVVTLSGRLAVAAVWCPLASLSPGSPLGLRRIVEGGRDRPAPAPASGNERGQGDETSPSGPKTTRGLRLPPS